MEERLPTLLDPRLRGDDEQGQRDDWTSARHEIFDRVRKKLPAKLLLIGDGPA